MSAVCHVSVMIRCLHVHTWPAPAEAPPLSWRVERGAQRSAPAVQRSDRLARWSRPPVSCGSSPAPASVSPRAADGLRTQEWFQSANVRSEDQTSRLPSRSVIMASCLFFSFCRLLDFSSSSARLVVNSETRSSRSFFSCGVSAQTDGQKTLWTFTCELTRDISLYRQTLDSLLFWSSNSISSSSVFFTLASIVTFSSCSFCRAASSSSSCCSRSCRSETKLSSQCATQTRAASERFLR